MRIIQIIDSLDIGGAEKMAVNYANALSNRIEFSGLVVTRKEGELKKQLIEKVHYLFLNRKSTIDIMAVLKLRNFCKKNKINYLQAHSSSFFTAILIKLTLPKLKIIWHDHNGLSEFLSTRKSFALKLASFLFDRVIVVNDQLKIWAERELYCKKIIYLSNFTTLSKDEVPLTKLQGFDRKKILCLANLRIQKNHFLLLDVAEKILESHPEWTFHLVGKDFNDDYSSQIKELIILKKMSENVFIYGSKNDTTAIISQADIAILTSQSEGLPVVILEYGLSKKAVVSSEVGEIPSIINDGINGFLVPKYDKDKFFVSLLKLIQNETLREDMGNNLHETILKNHSEEIIIRNYLNWI
jgi:glycosyltransferase involved in cell wall biosynthesis